MQTFIPIDNCESQANAHLRYAFKVKNGHVHVRKDIINSWLKSIIPNHCFAEFRAPCTLRLSVQTGQYTDIRDSKYSDFYYLPQLKNAAENNTLRCLILELQETEKNIIQEKRLSFIHDALCVGTAFNGMLQRGHVYKSNADDKAKEDFKQSLTKQLKELNQIVFHNSEFSEKEYLEFLILSQNEINTKHPEILKSDHFRFGSTQKLFNLYWKFLWLLFPEFPQPIHCPIDSIIISKLPKEFDFYKWTQNDSQDDYMSVIRGIQKEANGLSIAEWELINYTE